MSVGSLPRPNLMKLAFGGWETVATRFTSIDMISASDVDSIFLNGENRAVQSCPAV
jgi:hypothetical protein